MSFVISTVLLIGMVFYVARWVHSLRPIGDDDYCLVCGHLVKTNDAGDYTCKRCRFDAVRSRGPQFRPVVGLLKDLQEARRSLALARRHYDWGRLDAARPYLDEASSLLRDLYQEMPDLLGQLAADVTGAAGEAPFGKLIAEVPVLGIAVGMGSMFAEGAVAEDPAAVKRAGLGRLDAWDATLVEARLRLARRLATQMDGVTTRND